jgi:uncharacterized protein
VTNPTRNQQTPEELVARNGKRLSTPAAMRLTIANGQIVRMHLYEDTLAVHEAFTD